MIKILRLFGRGAKIIGMAAGTGGFLSGMLDPNTALLIAAGSVVLGDVIVFAGDWSDDGKINKSFTIDG